MGPPVDLSQILGPLFTCQHIIVSRCFCFSCYLCSPPPSPRLPPPCFYLLLTPPAPLLPPPAPPPAPTLLLSLAFCTDLCGDSCAYMCSGCVDLVECVVCGISIDNCLWLKLVSFSFLRSTFPVSFIHVYKLALRPACYRARDLKKPYE